MCTITVKVNENRLRDIFPELDTTAAISRWVQEVLDRRIDELVAKESETVDLEKPRTMVSGANGREYALQHNMTPEQLYNVISEEIDSIYANG